MPDDLDPHCFLDKYICVLKEDNSQKRTLDPYNTCTVKASYSTDIVAELSL